MKLVVLGLSITSSWGNGHATTYRALLGAFARRGHDVLFLERDTPWYADNRDAPVLPRIRVGLYSSVAELRRRHARDLAGADAVIVGSYVPDGIEVGRWVQERAGGTTAFYDIDTPVTLAALRRDACAYLSPELIPGYDVYLSFTGGPTLRELENTWGAPAARPLYCAVDASAYHPERQRTAWDLGYLGTYSLDRQPTLERLLLEPARRRLDEAFVVAGPQYPKAIRWPENVERIEHLEPSRHRAFYNRQRFTLNVTRADMIAAGWSPSVRLFEAAACGTPILTDRWPGLENFFTPGREILPVRTTADVLRILREFSPAEARAIGEAGRARVLARHTAGHRAAELETYLTSPAERRAAPRPAALTPATS